MAAGERGENGEPAEGQWPGGGSPPSARPALAPALPVRVWWHNREYAISALPVELARRIRENYVLLRADAVKVRRKKSLSKEQRAGIHVLEDHWWAICRALEARLRDLEHAA